MGTDFMKAQMGACNVRERYKLQERPVNLLKILDGEQLGVFYSRNLGDDDARLDKEHRMIMVARQVPPTRRMFSIAHELGHWFLHTERTEYMRNTNCEEHNSSIEEQEANAFAAELLMPIGEVEQLVVNRGYGSSELAKHFGVSKEFASYRFQATIKGIV